MREKQDPTAAVKGARNLVRLVKGLRARAGSPSAARQRVRSQVSAVRAALERAVLVV
jgi:hypothetical protein